MYFFLKPLQYFSKAPPSPPLKKYDKKVLCTTIINCKKIKKKWIPSMLNTITDFIEEDESGKNLQISLLNLISLLKIYKRKYAYIIFEILKLSVYNYLMEIGSNLDELGMTVGGEIFVIGARMFEMGDFGKKIGKEKDTAHAMYQFAIVNFRSLAARGRILELKGIWNISFSNFQFMDDVLMENIVIDKMDIRELLEDFE